MKSFSTLLLILATASVALLGCRQASLGKDTGVALRTAFDAQADQKRGKSPRLDATDAKQALDVHHYGPNGSSGGALSAPAPASMNYSGSSTGSAPPSSSSAAASDNGGIRLRAK